MQKQLAFFISSLIFILSSTTALADDYIGPGTAIIPEVQAPDPDKEVTSRFSFIYGRNKGVYGLDIGLVGNITDKTFAGTAFALGFNVTRGKAAIVGFQFGGLANWNTGNVYVFGLQASLGVNLNKGDGYIIGAQLAPANIAPKSNVIGVQVGLYNKAESVYGFQIGLYNEATSLHGVQLGLLNVHQKGALKYFPIINIGF